jgi:energy-converting hydrogenase Eha subunit F
VKRVLSFLLALIVAFVGVVGLLLFLQSRDDATLERPAPATQTQTTP